MASIVRKGALLAICAGIFLVPSLGFAIQVPPGLDHCPTLGECLRLLDSVVTPEMRTLRSLDDLGEESPSKNST